MQILPQCLQTNRIAHLLFFIQYSISISLCSKKAGNLNKNKYLFTLQSCSCSQHPNPSAAQWRGRRSHCSPKYSSSITTFLLDVPQSRQQLRGSWESPSFSNVLQLSTPKGLGDAQVWLRTCSSHRPPQQGCCHPQQDEVITHTWLSGCAWKLGTIVSLSPVSLSPVSLLPVQLLPPVFSAPPPPCPSAADLSEVSPQSPLLQAEQTK